LPAATKATEQVATSFETFCAVHPLIGLPRSEKRTVPVGAGGAGVAAGTDSDAVIVVRCPARTRLATRSVTVVCAVPTALAV
jgi:hypothetical protein